jgi:effector-binding domain-containing protein
MQGSMAEVIAALPAIWAELSVWLANRGVAAAGAPFIAYKSIRMPQWLAVEVGIPTATLASADGEVLCGELPAGDFVETLYVGHYDGLLEATAKLLKWGAEQDIHWDMQVRDGAEHWAARLESYVTDPTDEPDPAKWQTRLAIRIDT